MGAPEEFKLSGYMSVNFDQGKSNLVRDSGEFELSSSRQELRVGG